MRCGWKLQIRCLNEQKDHHNMDDISFCTVSQKGSKLRTLNLMSRHPVWYWNCAKVTCLGSVRVCSIYQYSLDGVTICYDIYIYMYIYMICYHISYIICYDIYDIPISALCADVKTVYTKCRLLVHSWCNLDVRYCSWHSDARQADGQWSSCCCRCHHTWDCCQLHSHWHWIFQHCQWLVFVMS